MIEGQIDSIYPFLFISYFVIDYLWILVGGWAKIKNAMELCVYIYLEGMQNPFRNRKFTCGNWWGGQIGQISFGGK